MILETLDSQAKVIPECGCLSTIIMTGISNIKWTVVPLPIGALWIGLESAAKDSGLCQ
jgi:hypothetical protein